MKENKKRTGFTRKAKKIVIPGLCAVTAAGMAAVGMYESAEAATVHYMSTGKATYYGMSPVYDSYKYVWYGGSGDSHKHIAYCMETTKNAPFGHGNLKKSGLSSRTHTLNSGDKKKMVAKVMYYGYGYPGFSKGLQKWAKSYKSGNTKKFNPKKVASTKSQGYVFTHQVIGYAYKGSSSFGFGHNAWPKLNSNWQSAIKSAYNYVKKLPAAPLDTSLSFSKVSGSTTYGGNYAKSAVYKLTSKASGNSVKFKVPSGYKVVNTSTGKTFSAGKIATIKEGNRFYVKTTSLPTKEKTFKIKVESELPNYMPFYIDPKGNYQDISFFGVGDKKTASLSIAIPGAAKLRLKKEAGGVNQKIYSLGDYNLSATYTAKNKSTGKSYTFKTNQSGGYSAYQYVQPGTYTIKETKAPTGMQLNKSAYSVTVKANTSTSAAPGTTKIVRDSVEVAGVVISKVDGKTKKPLKNAVFKIQQLKGTAVKATWYVASDSNGKIKIDSSHINAAKKINSKYTSTSLSKYTVNGKVVLPLGTYKYVEVKAPTGYKITSTKVKNKKLTATAKKLDEVITNNNNKEAPPSIKTTASIGSVDTETGKVTIIDKVTYDKLTPNTKYTFKGSLRDPKTEAVVKDSDGSDITATATLMPTASNSTLYTDSTSGKLVAKGSIDITFTFDQSLLTSGGSYVCYEYLYEGSTEKANHADPDDKKQTISFEPSIGTTALDSKTEDHIGEHSASAKIVDTVAFKNLVVGQEYTVKGKLMDKETGEPLTVDGEEITAQVKFKPNADGTVVYLDDEGDNGEEGFDDTGSDQGDDQGSDQGGDQGDDHPNEGQETTGVSDKVLVNGTVALTYHVDSTLLKGKTTVVFEDLLVDEDEVATHHEIEDDAQTIHFPDVQTEAKDINTDAQQGIVGKTTVKDTVKYSNLIPGKEYTLSAKLVRKKISMDQIHDTNMEEGDSVFDEIEGATAELKFTPEEADGEVEIEIPVDTSDLVGEAIVAFETVTYNDVEVAVHADIEDENQTIYVPEIGTTLTEKESGLHEIKPGEKTVITDVVEYKNLKPDTKYIMHGRLIDKDTGKEITDTYQEQEFTTSDTGSGEMTMEFVVDSTNLDGKSVVAFEKAYLGETEVVKHEDIDDEGQTVHFPKIGTTAKDSADGDHVISPTGKQTITDTIRYENLLPNTEYTASGYLVNQDGKPVEIDGKKITGTQKFTSSESGSGTVDVKFEFDSSKIKDTKLVVFEDVLKAETVIASHHDEKDENQTVSRIGLKTTAANYKNATKSISPDKNQVIVDTVETTGLTKGETYTLSGTLMDKETGKELMINGKKITATKEIKPNKENSFDLVFPAIDASELAGKKIVVFESLLKDKKEVANHKDINDVDQTVSVIKIKTTAVNKETGKKTINPKSGQIITDTVEYTGLTAGEKYTMKGTLMDKSTGKPVEVDGKKITASKDFTASGSGSGTVKMDFSVNAEKLGGKKLVVFEKAYYGDGEVAEHEDINDKDQTIEVTKTVTPIKKKHHSSNPQPQPESNPDSPQSGHSPRTGDSMKYIIIAVIAAAAAAGIGVGIRKRRKISK